MFKYLQIPNPRERIPVGLVDLLTAPAGWGGRRRPADVRRILLLRLERIGDLLMTRRAIDLVTRLAPEATIDLAVGSWNAAIAALLPGLDRRHLIDVPWLARDKSGASWPTLISTARTWRHEQYDLVVNFEPDIRSNFLAWLTGAPVRTGYSSGGGGAFLTRGGPYDQSTHVGENAERLVERSLDMETGGAAGHVPPPLLVPDEARQHADALLSGAGNRLIGVHASGGRPSKQWHPERFAAAAETLARRLNATLVLTGSEADRALVDRLKDALGDVPVVDAVGRLDLPGLMALLGRLEVLLTGDTGPMHLADAVGTPIVALFGPSAPERYGPRDAPHRILRIDLPCSPCGRVRLPPARCRGRVPECLDGISIDAVVAAATELLEPGTPV